MYSLKYSKQALKDAKRLKIVGLKEKVQKLLKEISLNPLSPPSKKLLGNMTGYYSRRINLQHRLVYEVFEDIKTVRIIRMWTHYEN